MILLKKLSKYVFLINHTNIIHLRIWTVKFEEFEKLLPQYEHRCFLIITSRFSTGI